MKLLFPLLAVSLLLNAAFALVFGLGSRSAPPATLATASIAVEKPTPPAITPEIWPELKTDDLSSLVTRLREAGFPLEIIRAIVAGQITDLFAARRKALQPPLEHLPFWKDRPPSKNDVALQQLYREQNKMLRGLLGEDPNSTERIYLTQQGGRLDFLPAEKSEAILGIIREFNDRRSDVFASGGYDREKISALEKAQHEAVARSLTPAELLDYDLRNTNTARDLRTSLASLDPSEEEFRAIFQLRQPFDEKYSFDGGLPNPDKMKERGEAEKRLNDQIKALLSPERAAEYERTTDYNYRQATQLVARLELPPETAVNLWNTQKEFQKRRSELFSNLPAPSPAERTQKLTELQQEAIAKVTPLLGSASHVEAYKVYGGQWLQNLVPRPPVPPAKN